MLFIFKSFGLLKTCLLSAAAVCAAAACFFDLLLAVVFFDRVAWVLYLSARVGKAGGRAVLCMGWDGIGMFIRGVVRLDWIGLGVFFGLAGLAGFF